MGFKGLESPVWRVVGCDGESRAFVCQVKERVNHLAMTHPIISLSQTLMSLHGTRPTLNCPVSVGLGGGGISVEIINAGHANFLV